MKNGERIMDYGMDVHCPCIVNFDVEVENESVIHLVERQDQPASFPASSSPGADNATTGGSGMRTGGANILFHAMQVDPSVGPAAMAQEITRSVMGALRNAMGEPAGSMAGGVISDFLSSFGVPVPGSNNAGTLPTNAPPASFATTNQDQNNNLSPSNSSNLSRLFSRPATRTAENMVSGHQTIRTDTRRAITNLNEDLAHLTTFSDGSDLFPSTRISSLNVSANSNDMQTVAHNLGHFERAYWMMAGACRELREGFNAGRIPWDRVVNFVGFLQEIPLLMVVQRRLLTTLRARQDGTAELPPFLDVPSFLGREISQPLEVAAPIESFENVIEPPE